MGELLAFDTQPDRPQIRIDGVLYDLAMPGDLTIAEQLWLERTNNTVRALWAQVSEEEDNEAAADRLQSLLNKLASVLLRYVPAEVADKLNNMQRMSIITAYSERLKEQARPFPAKAKSAEKVAPSTGSKSSHASSVSTAEAPKDG